MVHQVRQYHFSQLPRFNHAAYHSIACMQRKLLLSITVFVGKPRDRAIFNITNHGKHIQKKHPPEEC